jgi:hypothetical protein
MTGRSEGNFNVHHVPAEPEYAIADPDSERVERPFNLSHLYATRPQLDTLAGPSAEEPC